jgi:hypothetical protein
MPSPRNRLTPEVMVEEQQELAGLISQGRVQYGKLAVASQELGATLIKIRDLTKAQGSRTGKGFEACLEDIGISKTQAYRLIKAAETGEPVDYDNDTSSRNGTKLFDLSNPYESCRQLLGFPEGVELTPVGINFPKDFHLPFEQWKEIMKRLGIMAALFGPEPRTQARWSKKRGMK